MGTKSYWRDPDDYIETVFGDRRYFTLENTLTKILFDLSEKPPASWTKFNEKVVRTKIKQPDGTYFCRQQTAHGSTKSALLGAAFNMQNGIKRAAGNHLIQSVGARITKTVQSAIWGIQSPGINPWLVQPMNVHDEIMCPTYNGADGAVMQEVKRRVDEEVEKFRSKIPLIGMEWAPVLNSWADK
jgi:hypothetical protein